MLHACCHNPTGVDLNLDQWRQVLEIVKAGDLVAFLDIAYQGFGDGIEADGAAVRLFAESDVTFLVASSFSKSFSLYGERVGALTIVDQSKDESARVLSQLKRVIRANYSTPPTHGGMVVATVLNTPQLRTEWEAELGEMRTRIKAMRRRLVQDLAARRVKTDFGFIEKQNGMFSYTGLTSAQVHRLGDRIRHLRGLDRSHLRGRTEREERRLRRRRDRTRSLAFCRSSFARAIGHRYTCGLPFPR